MHLRPSVVASAAALIALADIARAQQATQVVTFQVTSIRQIAVTGNPAPLVIDAATAGSAPASATSSGTSYAITTNEPNQKIIASLSDAMPAGVTLEVTLTPPTGATGMGAVALGTAGVDVVSAITATTAAGLPITYRLSATPLAQVTTPATRTVTFTIVSGT